MFGTIWKLAQLNVWFRMKTAPSVLRRRMVKWSFRLRRMSLQISE